ncbi:hypothetical protein GCM10023084_07600 [Streptomyces lacrimifluminis]|uniref:Uncharacterized protein n=1 Tax=Streptomyces lacrimifluminis TaxID=1500077 RepID=A0A917KT44_9ACTN|nr:hypothetical protein [Streptomyces lacrimifluminis]GGJ25191.1 hypothetical protein GCM10012282_22280 [Streptomyces lacrimifluminis]
MGKGKNTVAAAAAAIKRDTARNPAPSPDQTQGALADRHVRQNTPDSLYGDDSATDNQEGTDA